jgi:hypothetical protein
MSSPLSARPLRALVPLALVVIAVAASSYRAGPGITFKIKTQLRNHPVPEKSHPDSVAIKRRAAAAAARADSIAAVSGAGSGDVAGGGGAPPGRGGAGAGGPGCRLADGTTNNVMTMNAAFVKGSGRFDVAGVVGCPELRATQSAIITDTSTLFVDDVQKNFCSSYFDIGSILAFTSAVDNPQVKVGMLKVSWDTLPSESYEGRQAKHYQLKMLYGLGQRGREDSLKDLSITDVTSDYLVEDLPVNFENRFAGIGRPRRQVPDSLRAEWEKMLALYAQLGKGTVVKFTATGFIGINGPTTTQYTRTMEMTNIMAADVDESRLKVPSDYARAGTQGRGRGC